MSNKSDATSRQDMMSYLAQNSYQSNANKIIIDEFDRDYKSSDAIRWYTKSPLLYCLLNKALRESDFDALFALRSFIVDLYKQILVEHEKSYKKNIKNCDSFCLKVYRGQELSKEELNILRQKQGGYFSMQSFLSTSTNFTVAHIYSGAGDAVHPDLNKVWILYEFKIDTCLNNTKPYAPITHMSQHKDEDEILVALGAVFRIDSIQFDNVNHRWHAILSLCDDEGFDLCGILQQYAAEIVFDRISPGFLLYQLGNYVKAREYFQKMLSITPLTDSEKAHCYRGLGAVAAEENNYIVGYEYFREEYDVWQKLQNDVRRMGASEHIGDMLLQMRKYKEALEYLQKAFDYFILNNYEMECTRICGMLGQIMIATEQWDKCLVIYKAQLKVRERILDPNHEDIGITYANIGVAYGGMKNYKKAIEYYRKALNIYKHSLPSVHPNVLKAEENLRNAVHLLSKAP